ncbi:hypothetical protein ACFWD7_43905 [Streptomyces mirabilis]|uniref:hypothetical protein n=1 Tax=Streptomyces mirabilis TaxID=68239 RepID=UPI00369AE681
MIQNMLRHPVYAGVYVYGPSRTDPRRRLAGRVFTRRVRKPPEDWLVYLLDVLPAYRSAERHERNLARIEAIRACSQSMGALRDGPALLVRLIYCGQLTPVWSCTTGAARAGSCGLDRVLPNVDVEGERLHEKLSLELPWWPEAASSN